MNKITLLLVVACILVSCGPGEQPIQQAIKETSDSTAELPVREPTRTHTSFPSPTDIPTKTPTETSTIIPSSTFIPTDTPTAPPTDTPTSPPTNTPTARATNTSVPIPTETRIPLNACIPTNTNIEQATVINIIDGDTIDVVIDGEQFGVQYIGIDTPEMERPLYEEANKANSDLVLNKEVTLVKDLSETDSFDRLLRYVFVGDVFVNLEMVKQGLAVAEDYPPDSACALTLAKTMNDARTSQYGIWQATQTPQISAPIVVITYVNKEAEYVDIQNQGKSDVNLSGWNLVSEKGNQACPLSGILKAGETLQIWAMQAEGTGYSCGFSKNIWNNSEPDPAVLYNPEGVEVSRK